MEHSAYVFNIMVIKFNVNIACYMLHFVTINVAVFIKPWQYHMHGLFLLSPDRARPLRLTARLHPPGKVVTAAVFGIITIRIKCTSCRMKAITENWVKVKFISNVPS